MSRFQQVSRNVFAIHEFASQDECERWIAQAEIEGFDAAPVTTRQGPVSMPDVRNNTRVMRDDPALTGELWARLKGMMTEPWLDVPYKDERFGPCGLNERLRFYRYDAGERFAMHRDGYFAREDGSGERSMLTVLLYLNEGFEGGETVIFESGQSFEVKPRQGLLLCFAHRLLHEGVAIISGRKYVLRTDVMYHPCDV